MVDVIVTMPSPVNQVNLLEQGPPGPVGPVGPQGPPGNSVNVVLSATVSGGQCVALIGGLGQPAAVDTFADAAAFIGVAAQGGNAGGTIVVVTLGELSETGWTWTPGQSLWIGAAGALTQTSPSTGFAVLVGEALSAGTIFIRPESPIQLS